MPISLKTFKRDDVVKVVIPYRFADVRGIVLNATDDKGDTEILLTYVLGYGGYMEGEVITISAINPNRYNRNWHSLEAAEVAKPDNSPEGKLAQIVSYLESIDTRTNGNETAHTDGYLSGIDHARNMVKTIVGQ